ncbi:MAG: cell division protein FtsA [bacterium]|nr:cell division protein FtsA [bacterium]
MRDLICGIDVGSRTIRMVAGESLEDGRGVRLIGAVELPSAGIRRGTVTSMEDAIASIAAATEQLERMSGAPIRSVFVGVSGPYVAVRSSRGVVAVARTDGEVQEGDIERALEAARAGATPPNFEVLHIIPRVYALDHQEGIRDPIGMTGARLEVEASIIQAVSTHIRNLTTSIFKAGLVIDDLVLGSLATAEAVTTPRQRDLGVAVANIGATTTSVVVEEEGDVIHIATIPIGAEHVTSDIAIGLRIALDQAERLKLAVGTAMASGIKKQEEIDLEEVAGGEPERVSRRYVAEIIEARMEEVFEKIDRELTVAGCSGSLPAGIILVGAGAKLPGIVEVARRKLRLSVAVGRPCAVDSVIERVFDPGFATATGLVIWGAAGGDRGGRKNSVVQAMFRPLNTIVDRTKHAVRGIFS